MNMKKSLAVVLGTTFSAAMSASPVVNADANPFGMQNLEGGYIQVAEAEGKCGEGKGKAKAEGKCGEGKCGEGKDKAKAEGKCGEGKCGEGKAKTEGKAKAEGKCGEGKCGGS
ncbi:MAG: hypothetical protein RQ982_05260 [Gammaproteobacteria bacterium]|nr:hypothetical protein [Gammaproteobacteria bacterium]